MRLSATMRGSGINFPSRCTVLVDCPPSRIMTAVSRLRRRLLPCAVAAIWALFAAASAQASPWTITELHLGENETVFAMNCEANGFCIGVGQEGVVIQSSAPTAGGVAWSIGHLTLGEGLRGNLRGISCPSSNLCVAADYSGGVWTTTNPAGGAGAWQPTKIPKAKSIFDVACTSTSQCVLVGSNGLIVTSSNPTGGTAAWNVTHISEQPPLRAIACSGSLCVAGDFEGGIWTTTAPGSGAGGWTGAGQPAGENAALGLTCQSEVLCLAGNSGSVLTSTNPTGGTAAWVVAPLSRRFQILAASCPSASLCVLSSNNGEVFASTNPLGGSSTWLTEHLIGGVTNAMFGLSCPTTTLCVAGGKYGQLLTTTNPAATGLPEPPPPTPPNTVLLHKPRKTIRLGVRTPAPTVAFRFGAEGEATYYRCRIDSKPGALCSSPRKFRLGTGSHVFRVRAFGPGGPDATLLTYRFRVVRAKPKPPKPRRRHHGKTGKSSGL
jgi:hypothetical protein